MGSQSNRYVAWPARVFIGIVLGILVRYAASNAEAEHSYDPHDHIGSILRSSDGESNCVRVFDSSISHDDAYNKIKDTLSNAQNSDKDWDGIRYVQFNGLTNYTECPLDIAANYEISKLRIWFQIAQDWDADCGGPYAGCERTFFGYDDPASGHFGIGQREYYVSVVRVETDALINRTYHIVNHEVGHSLGLCDGGPDIPTPTPSSCADESALACTGSIMHSYGCDDADWPSAQDRASVESLVPSPPSGGFGGCGRGISSGC